MRNWFSSSHTSQAGRPATYSNEAILMMLLLREVYKLTLRGLQGFVSSIFLMMGLNLPVPSYSQISRRAKLLHKQINRLVQGKKARHIIFDSTGLKVYGEGEWKMRVHGKTKRRTWRKFHIGIDAETQDILCCELTENNKGDAEVAEHMLEKLPCKVKSAEEMTPMMPADLGRKSMIRGVPALYRHQEMQPTKARLGMCGNKKGMLQSKQSRDLAEMI